MKMDRDGTICGERLFKYLCSAKDVGRNIIPFHVTDKYIVTYNGLLLVENIDYNKETDLTFNFNLRRNDLIEVIKPEFDSSMDWR